MIQNNLPPESQQWARDLERRVASTELLLSNNSASDSAARAVLGNAQASVSTLERRALAQTFQTLPYQAFNVNAPTSFGSHMVLLTSFTITLPPFAYALVSIAGRITQSLTGYTGSIGGEQDLSLVGKLRGSGNTVEASGVVRYDSASAVAANTYQRSSRPFIRTRETQLSTVGLEYPASYVYEVYLKCWGSGGGTNNIFGEYAVWFETAFADSSNFITLGA